jgi:hypothetical protein
MVSVVLPTVPLTAFDEKAVVKATVPPLEAVPLTTRKALLSWVVDFVQPVGAEVCANSMAVPAGKALGAAPEEADVNRPCASTVILAYVYDPAETAVLAKEIVPVVVIGPPDSPVPVATDVTDPLPVPAPRFERAVAASVAPVPPLTIAKVPLTWVCKPTLPQAGAVPTPPESSALPATTSASFARDVAVSA